MITIEELTRDYKSYNLVDTEHQYVIRDIAKEYPYGIEDVATLYIRCGCSEKLTKQELAKMVKRGY